MKKVVLSILLMAGFAFSSMAQEPNYGENPDACKKYVSLYTGYMQQKAFKDAYEFWRKAVEICPEYKPLLYSNGIYIIKKYKKEINDDTRESRLNDTIIWAYEQGIKYFGKTPDLAEDMGVDMFLYKRESHLQEASDLMKEAIDGLREETKASTLIYYTQSLALLKNDGKVDCDVMIPEYERISGFAEANKDQSGFDMVQEKADKLLGPCLSCDKLVPLMQKKYEAAPEDLDNLKKIYATLTKRECEDNDLFAQVVEGVIKQEPTAEGYFGLAKIYIGKGDYDKSEQFINKSVELSKTNEDKEKYLSALMKIYASKGRYSNAKSIANDILKINPNSGDAYLTIARATAASSSGCGDAFSRQTVYWVAYDIAAKAKSVDSSVASEASQLMGQYQSRFPEKTEMFLREVQEGQSYTVSCLGQSTTARAK